MEKSQVIDNISIPYHGARLRPLAVFCIHTYSKADWYKGPHTMYYYYVERDKQMIYES